MKTLTPRQSDALVAFSLLTTDAGGPSVRELARRLGVNSVSTAHQHLTALERKGFLWRPRGKTQARSWAITDAGQAWLDTAADALYGPQKETG